ncbi:hypothetical protein ZWY2020_003259 [Hordeum vulgare]|nr:hypothetical protein ZWY2020_003259 [Hordeum vulgare]
MGACGGARFTLAATRNNGGFWAGALARCRISSSRSANKVEFADNLEHLDPVPLVLLPNNGAGLAVPEDSNAGSGCQAVLSSFWAMGLLENEFGSAAVRMALRRGRCSRLTESIQKHLAGQKLMHPYSSKLSSCNLLNCGCIFVSAPQRL